MQKVEESVYETVRKPKQWTKSQWRCKKCSSLSKTDISSAGFFVCFQFRTNNSAKRSMCEHALLSRLAQTLFCSADCWNQPNSCDWIAQNTGFGPGSVTRKLSICAQTFQQVLCLRIWQGTDPHWHTGNQATEQSRYAVFLCANNWLVEKLQI